MSMNGQQNYKLKRADPIAEQSNVVHTDCSVWELLVNSQQNYKLKRSDPIAEHSNAVDTDGSVWELLVKLTELHTQEGRPHSWAV